MQSYQTIKVVRIRVMIPSSFSLLLCAAILLYIIIINNNNNNINLNNITTTTIILQRTPLTTRPGVLFLCWLLSNFIGYAGEEALSLQRAETC